MALTPRYLADKSALARMTNEAVTSVLAPLIESGDVATCGIIDLEILYSARDRREYEEVLEERRALPDVPITPQIITRAIDIQHQLATRGRHRLPIPDLIIAAAAESAGTIVLHYDADFETIALVTGQAHEWVVPRGTIP